MDQKCRIDFVYTDDWTALYVDGALRVENHSLEPDDVLDAIKDLFPHTSRWFYIEPEVVADNYDDNFPRTLCGFADADLELQ